MDFKMNDPDIVSIFAQFTDYIQNERTKAFNEGVEAERKRCMDLVAKRAAVWRRNPGGACSLPLEEECEDIAVALSLRAGFAEFRDEQ